MDDLLEVLEEMKESIPEDVRNSFTPFELYSLAIEIVKAEKLDYIATKLDQFVADNPIDELTKKC